MQKKKQEKQSLLIPSFPKALETVLTSAWLLKPPPPSRCITIMNTPYSPEKIILVKGKGKGQFEQFDQSVHIRTVLPDIHTRDDHSIRNSGLNTVNDLATNKLCPLQITETSLNARDRIKNGK